MQHKPLIDLTREGRLNRHADDLCSDLDEECQDISCHLSCWLHAPELGICPYLKNERKS